MNAIAKVRAKTPRNQGGRRRRGLGFSLIPLATAVVLALPLLPRSSPPSTLLLPQVSESALRAIERRDDEDARTAHTEGVAVDLAPLLRAIEALQREEANDDAAADFARLRVRIDEAVAGTLRTFGPRGLAQVRAIELQRFLSAVRAFQATGVSSGELTATAGPFVKRMSDAGWLKGRALALTERELRVAYKLAFNQLLRFDAPELSLALDEHRALLRFFLLHPRMSERSDALLRSLAAAAPLDPRREGALRRAGEAEWQAERIRKHRSIDPEYPADLALASALSRAGDHARAQVHLDVWLREHEEGPYAKLAHNFGRWLAADHE